MRIEHEYSREGSVNYLAAWDVHRAKVFGHCEPKSTIVSFERFVGEVMRRKPYRTAKRVFWIVDNASIHRGKASVERFRQQWPNSVLVHTPTHASWLNQVEILGQAQLGGKILRGERELSKNHIRKLCDYFKVGPELCL